MRMSALQKIVHHFIPSHHNAYRPHILKRTWLVFFLALALAAEGFLVANLVVRGTGENFLAAVISSEIIHQTNRERVRNGIGGLTENTQLDAAAFAKAQDMARKGYFAHVGPGGIQPWEWIRAAGYTYQYAGENLAVRFVDSSDVVNAWMASPSHHANMVKEVYTDIGVGIAQGVYEGQPATFVVQYFANKPVAGAAIATSATQANSFLQGIQRYIVRFFSDPHATATIVLGSLGALLLVVLALAFFIHIQIQPTDMLLGGAFVAVFVFVLVALNAHVLRIAVAVTPQSASIESVGDILLAPTTPALYP